MNRAIMIAVLMTIISSVGCAKYVEPMMQVHTHIHSLYKDSLPVPQTPGQSQQVRQTQSTRAVYVTDGPIVLDQINEEAFIEYRDSLKDAVQLISVLSNPQMANPYFVTQIHTQLATSIIEIEQWPADLRETAWRTMGREIVSLGKLFDTNRQRLVADQRYAQDFRNALTQIDLLSRE